MNRHLRTRSHFFSLRGRKENQGLAGTTIPSAAEKTQAFGRSGRNY